MRLQTRSRRPATMSELEFRALAKEPYHHVIERLDRVAAGENAAREELLGSVRAALSDHLLQRRNARCSQLRFWDDWLETVPLAGSASTIRLLAKVSPLVGDPGLSAVEGRSANWTRRQLDAGRGPARGSDSCR